MICVDYSFGLIVSAFVVRLSICFSIRLLVCGFCFILRCAFLIRFGLALRLVMFILFSWLVWVVR